MANEVVFLNSVLSHRRSESYPEMDERAYFELFTFDQTLKDYELSDDELGAGRVAGGNDGGVDGFFVFVDEEVKQEVPDRDELSAIRRNAKIDLWLVQAKTEETFRQTPFERLASTSRDIFDFAGKDLASLTELYNAQLLEMARVFRELCIGAQSKHPAITIHFMYATKGSTENIHPNVTRKAEDLRAVLLGFFADATIDIRMLGARELLNLSRVERTYTHQLRLVENPLTKGDGNYVVLASLSDYFRFVTDETGRLRQYIFDSNVRDWQGPNIEVNQDIRATLESSAPLDFWWLNNGITVVASRATIAAKTMTLDDVQVVNGLQTTRTLYEHLRTHPEDEERNRQRSILVRVVVTSDTAVRDRIIKATNFQTSIPPASLKAMEQIQRDIEDFFKGHGLFYDRRKNYYKNIGKPASKIIGIPALAQAVMAIVLLEPDNARARPSSLIKRPADYSRVFSSEYPPETYLCCAKIIKAVFSVVRGGIEDYTREELEYFRFHTAMVAIASVLGGYTYTPGDVAALVDKIPSREQILASNHEVVARARLFISERGWERDRVAKSKEFVQALTGVTRQ